MLQAAATAANWKPWVAGSNLSKENIVTGRGIANSHHGGAYAAVVADIQVNKKTGKILVTHLYAAQDSGFAMNPSLIYNQMIGNVIQGTSRALSEEVTFNKNQVTSDRLGHLPDPPLQGLTEGDERPRPAARISRRSGSGEPVTCPIDRRDRQRVLRRDRRAHARGADDAGPRPRDPQGRRHQLDRQSHGRHASSGPETGPSSFSRPDRASSRQ